MRVYRMLGGIGLVSCAGAAAFAQSRPAPKKVTTPAAQALLRYIVAPTGNEARYRVREQLIGFDLPNDAVGVTHDITGMVIVAPNGTIMSDSSRIVVTLTNIKSDKDRRDKFIKRKTMETEKFPTVELVPKSFVGLASEPGVAGSAFDVIGDLTVHGVTHPTTWKVNARSEGQDVIGTATTAFTFKDFALDQPRVPVVLSVEDTIKLEYDFRFTPAQRAMNAQRQR